MDDTNATVQQVVRIIMYFASSWLVTVGVDTDSEIKMVTGALTGVVALVWWFFWNKNQSKA